MKILLVSYLFPPTNAIGSVRVGKLAKHFLRQGHDLRVLAGLDDDLPQSLPLEIPDDRVVRTSAFQVNALPRAILGRQDRQFRSGTHRASPLSVALRRLYRTIAHIPDGQIGWLPYALAAGRRLLRQWRPDVIYASAMPYTCHLVAAKLSQEFGIPWVAEFRDLWADNPYNDYPGWRHALNRWMEKRTLASASRCVTVSEPLAETLRQLHGKPTTVVLNGFDPEDYEVPPPPSPLLPPETLNIVYTGLVYYRRRDPSVLFRALNAMGPDREQVRVHFFGRMLPEVKVTADAEGVGHLVQVHEAVPYRQSIDLQMAADIVLLLLWDDPVEHGVLTGKLFEYIGAGRPILASGYDHGLAANLIRERQLGAVCSDPQQMAAQLQLWLEQKRAGGIVTPPPAAKLGLSRFDQFKILETFLHDLVPGQS